MPRKSRQIILRHIVPKIIQQQKRIKIRCVPETEGPAQMHARSFAGRLRFHKPLYGSNGHGSLPRKAWISILIPGRSLLWFIDAPTRCGDTSNLQPTADTEHLHTDLWYTYTQSAP